MSNIYVITETSFEYNDEIYHETESGGGEPVKAYSTKAAADTACDEKIQAWVDEKLNGSSSYDRLSGYGYGPDEVINLNKFASLTGFSHSELEDAWTAYNGTFETMVQKFPKEIIESLAITPYKVVAIELA